MTKCVFHPRAYGIQFEMYGGTSGFAFLQNIVDGAQPIALFNSLDKSCEFFGDLDIPNHYNKTEIDAIGDELSALVLNTYTKTEIEALTSNINLTGSENISITNNQFSLTFPIKMNGGIVFIQEHMEFSLKCMLVHRVLLFYKTNKMVLKQ